LETAHEKVPYLTVGNVFGLNKNWSIISQLSSKYSVFDTFSLGAKFQPCSHMHAGIGLVSMVSAKPSTINLRSLQSSLYFATHTGGTFGFVGTASLHPSVASNVSIGITSRLDPWLPRRVLSSDPEGKVEIPSPVVGFNYDSAERRISGHVDLQFTAAPSTVSNRARQIGPISLKIKIGVDYIPGLGDPRLSFHLNATEASIPP
jgi:hypothetical protein